MHVPFIIGHHIAKGAVLAHVAHHSGASAAGHTAAGHAAMTGAGFAGKAAVTKVVAHGAVAKHIAAGGVVKRAAASSAHACTTPAVRSTVGSIASAATPAATL